MPAPKPRSSATSGSSVEYGRHAQELWIPGRLPGLNELVAARFQTGRARGGDGARWNGYSDLKRKTEKRIAELALLQRLKPMASAHCHYLLIEADRRRDPSNVLAGAMKVTEDALKNANLLASDGWAGVLSITPDWLVATTKEIPGVYVYFHPDHRWMSSIIREKYGALRERGYRP